MVLLGSTPTVVFDMTGIRSQSIFESIFEIKRRQGIQEITEELVVQTLTVCLH